MRIIGMLVVACLILGLFYLVYFVEEPEILEKEFRLEFRSFSIGFYVRKPESFKERVEEYKSKVEDFIEKTRKDE